MFRQSSTHLNLDCDDPERRLLMASTDFMLGPLPQIPRERQDSVENRASIPTYKKTLGRSRTRNTQLLDAIDSNKNDLVARLLKAGASPEATCRVTYISACHVAALSNGVALRILIEAGAKTDRVDMFGRTPLHFAAMAGAAEHIAMLLDFPQDLQDQVFSGLSTETEEAISSLRPKRAHMTNVPAIKQYRDEIQDEWKDTIEHKCKGFKKDIRTCSERWTPLHVASQAAHHDCVRILLAAGADPSIKDENEAQALDVAGGACFQDMDIKDADFVETIKALRQYGAQLRSDDEQDFISVLHTAVRLGSSHALPLLLEAGAPVHYWDHDGFTPLHNCVKKQLKEPLEILVKHKLPGQIMATVDVKDYYGSTVLQLSIGLGWVPGVCVALESGADVTLTGNYDDTAFHLAASIGDPDVLNELFCATQDEYVLNKENQYGETPITKAVMHGHIECVRFLLEEGASLDVTCIDKLMRNSKDSEEQINKSPKGKDILHVATSAGNKNMLEFLLKYDKSLADLLLHEVPSLGYKIPLEYAAEKNHFDTFKFLFFKTFKIKNRATSFNKARLIDTIATYNRKEIYEFTTQQWSAEEVFYAVNEGKALHNAIRYASRDMVISLLKSGADLSQTNENGQTALSMLMYYLPKATEFMEEIFDSFIYCNGKNIYDRDCEITIDYNVFVPREKFDKKNQPAKTEQMQVLKALLETGNRKGQRNLLAHPLVQSFLDLKWKTLFMFVSFIILIYIMFLISLNGYIVTVFYQKEGNLTMINISPVYNTRFWQSSIYVTACLIVVQEFLMLNLNNIRWIYEVETWFKFITIALGSAIPHIVNADISSAISTSSRNWATLAVVLSWLNMLILLSWTPAIGYYMQIYGKVSYKLVKVLFSYSFLIICFAISFMIQFQCKDFFANPMESLFKTIVMMTSEFDYGGIVTATKASTAPMYMFHIMFLLFLVFIAIVLMNLMVGVAVNDLTILEHKGTIRRLQKQVACLCLLEEFTNTMSIRKVPLITKIKVVESKGYRRLYTEKIRELITNKAQSNYDMKEKERENKQIKTKLDEILEMVGQKRSKGDVIDETEEPLMDSREKLDELIQMRIESAVTEIKTEMEKKFEKMLEIFEQSNKNDD